MQPVVADSRRCSLTLAILFVFAFGPVSMCQTAFSQDAVSLQSEIVDGLSSEYRQWTLSSGRQSDVSLRVVQRNGAVVKLQRQDDQRIVELPLSQLSPADRKYVLQITAAKPKTEVGSRTATVSGEWPSWRGADRSGCSSEVGLLTAWPSGGPKLAWQINGLGKGFSTPTVADGKVYVLGTKGQQEILFALDERSGRQAWALPMGNMAGGGGYPGPRGSATIDGGQVFAIGSDGSIVAAGAANGKLQWAKNFRNDFQGRCGNWDFSESPLVDGDWVIATPGGSQATLVAMHRRTGAVVWAGSTAALGDEYGKAAYSSPIVAELGGVKQYIQFLNQGVAGFRATDGQLLWHYDRPANGTANCSTPIARDGSVFAASGYGTGGGRAKIENQGAQFEAVEEYFVNKLQNHHGGMVLVDDHLYGTNDSLLLCVNWQSGEIQWQQRCVGKGSVAFADGHLYVRSEDGPVALVAADPAAFREVSRFDQPHRSDRNAWAHPVIAGGRLYLRDDDLLLCYELN